MARHAVILAGGSGTRLWPYSTRRVPKQLVPLFDGATLLDLAVERARAVVPDGHVWVCTGAELASAIDARGGIPVKVIVEPAARDTLAAIAYAAAVVAASDPEATLAILTADHVIEPLAEFAATLDRAFALAEADARVLVTLGVTPDHAATGYGYLELADGDADAHRVSLFREKPDLATATEFLAAGPSRYLWNSGMFVWQAGTVLAAADAFADGAGSVCRAVAATSDADTRLRRWESLPKRSIDYAVMEPASVSAEFAVVAVELRAAWRDVGSWNSLGSAVPVDDHGNAVIGRAVVESSSECVVANAEDGHVVAVLGCDDLVVVHTPGATLIVPRQRAEDVKRLHGEIARLAPDQA